MNEVFICACSARYPSAAARSACEDRGHGYETGVLSSLPPTVWLNPGVEVARGAPVTADMIETKKLTGGDVNYYVIDITDPKRLAPCSVEVDDINHALDMRFDEGTVWKSLVRFCKLRMDAGKPGSSFDYEAEKIVYYGILILKRAVGKARLIAFLEKQLAGLKGSQDGTASQRLVALADDHA